MTQITAAGSLPCFVTRGLVYAALLLCAPAVVAAPCKETPGTGIPEISLEQFAAGFDQPVHITHAGDASRRLFVVEQPGRIRIIDNETPRAEPFLDIRKRVASGGEKGLFSVAFHPRYKDNGWFYVNYTSSAGGLHTVVSRFRRASRNRADANSETVLLTIDQPYGNHNGGQLAFAPDGYLYIGMGDGGAGNDPHGHGQNTATLLGALLRIDVDRHAPGRTYAVPGDNPFIGKAGIREEIWAYGLRNPWRFSFDALNGRLYLADVGQDTVEEINIIRRGGNYGWKVMEGDICTPGVRGECDKSGLQAPILTYRHPKGFSITGGFVYRGSAIPALCGVYLYADYITQRLWGLRHDNDKDKVIAHTEFFNESDFAGNKTRLGGKGPHISSFGQDEGLELYLADHRSGRIIKIVPAQD